MKNLNHNITIIKSSLSILSKWIVPRLPVSIIKQNEYRKYILFWQDKVTSYIVNYGVLHASKRAKTIRAITLAYLAGTPIRSVPEMISIRNGIPKDLKPLSSLITSGDHVDIKFLLTLLSVTKVLTCPPNPNLSSISGESTCNEDQEWSTYIRAFFKRLRIEESSVEYEFSQYHMSTKTSPNGNGALADAVGELFILHEKFPTLYQSIQVLGGDNLKEKMDTLVNRLIVKPNIGDKVRRLSYISDKECKTRTVAILDYWSQTSLIPLHESLFKILKLIKSDQTFNQGSFVNRLNRGPYFSFDLKDATDRFPISLQRKVLNYLIGEKAAEAWQTILVHEPYYTPEGNPIKYSTGQPMGAYSSWATFAITHHLVVYRAACMAGKPYFRDYALLGDDIVICDRQVSLYYEKLMLELGIEFSKTKTFKSEKMYEFASRIFLNDCEVSPFSLKGVWESCSQPASVVEFLRTMQNNGWNLLRDGNIPGQIRSLIRLTGKPVFRKHDSLIDAFYQLPLKVFYKKDSHLSAIPLLQSLSCFPNQYIQRLQNAMIEILTERVETKIEEINDIHMYWQIALMGDHDEIFKSSPGDDPVQPGVLPLLGCWFRLKRNTRVLAAELAEAYMDEYNELPLERWVELFTDLSNIPDIRKVFRERKHKQIILTSSSLILSALKRARKY